MNIPVITGPTSLGKTALALKIAQHIDLEIINADAFQVYKSMNIGTAKPDFSQLHTVKHHLVDILTPDEHYSAGKFFEHCKEIIPKIIQRKKIPLIVGGTGLYVKCLTEGMSQIDAKDENIYKELEEECEKYGLKKLFNKLKNIDPEYAQMISENDKIRVLRALEAFLVSNMPFSQIHKEYHTKLPYRFHVAVLWDDRAKMYERINLRVRQMFDAGWVNEVEELLSMGYSANCPGFRALGYREISQYLTEGGEINKIVDIISQKTRNYAKRQVTWFRHRSNVTFYKAEGFDVEGLIRMILSDS